MARKACRCRRLRRGSWPGTPKSRRRGLRNDLKKAFEKALADGTIVRVKGQIDSGASLTGSFKIANKKPAAKPKAPAKKPSTTSAGSAVAKGKTDAPTVKATGRAQKEEDGKKLAAKKKPAPVKKAKVPVKKTVSGTSTASTASTASSASAASAISAASLSSYGSAALSPRAAVKGDATFSVEASSPNTLRPAAPRQKKAAQEARSPTGKENVPPGSKVGGKKRTPAAPAEVEAPKPASRKTKAKAGSASKVTGK